MARKRNRPPHDAALARARFLKWKYGISADDYTDMLASQGGARAVCRRSPPEGGRPLSVDHDHDTGMVRGLLCHGCNTSLGLLKEDLLTLLRLVRYLVRHRQLASRRVTV